MSEEKNQPKAARAKKYTPRTLAELFGIFFKIGLVTFGGGLAMLPILERELVDRRKWTSRERLMDYFVIGQSTPGIIAINVATFIGYTRAGVLGGCIATLGVVTPSIVIITLIAKVFVTFSSIAWVQKMLAGINIAVAALLTKVLWGFRTVVFKNAGTVALFAASFVLVVVFKVNTAFVIIAALALGAANYALGLRRKPPEQGEGGGNEPA